MTPTMTSAKSVFKGFLFLSVLLTVLLAAGMEVSATGLTLLAEEKEVVGEDRVEVAIKAENAAGVEGGQFVLHFDPALLKPVSIEEGKLVKEASDSLSMANLEYAEGQLMFMWITAHADTADSGELCIITFDLLEEGDTALEIKDIVISPDDIEDEEDPVDEENAINDEEALIDTENGVTGFQWLVGLIVLVILAAVGYIFYKWLKKPGAKH